MMRTYGLAALTLVAVGWTALALAQTPPTPQAPTPVQLPNIQSAPGTLPGTVMPATPGTVPAPIAPAPVQPTPAPMTPAPTMPAPTTPVPTTATAVVDPGPAPAAAGPALITGTPIPDGAPRRRPDWPAGASSFRRMVRAAGRQGRPG